MATLSLDISRRPSALATAQKHRQDGLRTALGIVFYGAALAVAAYMLLRAWQGIAWWDFWLVFVIAATLFFALVKNLIFSQDIQALDKIPELLVSRPAPPFAPLAEQQPLPLVLAEDESFIIGTTKDTTPQSGLIHSLARQSNEQGSFLLQTIASGAFAGIGIVQLLLLFNGAFGFSARLGGVYFLVSALGNVLFLIFAFLSALGPLWLYSRNLLVVSADKDGIYWQSGAEQVIVPWQSMRFLARIENVKNTRRQRAGTSGYVLLTDDYFVLWLVKADATPEEQQTSQALCSLIAAQAHISLHDMSQLFEELRTSRLNLRRVVAKRKAAGRDVHFLEPLIAESYTTTLREPFFRAARFALALMLLIPALVLAGISNRAEAAQDAYFANLPTRLQHQTPLYQNTFARADPAWPTQIPSGNDVFGAAFTAQGYQLQGLPAERYLTALGPGTYGDAAIAVTVHPGSSERYRVAAGIVVRASGDGSQALVLSLELFTRYITFCNLRDTGIDSGCRSLHDEENVKHYGDVFSGSYRLFVVMHGDSFLFYINGQLACTYIDAAGLVPRSGRVGLYSAYSGQSVTFTDLAIYPAGGATPWDYI